MIYTNTRGRGAVLAVFVVLLATMFVALGQRDVPAAGATAAAVGESHDVVMLPEVVVTATRLESRVDSVASLNGE
jgi:hypothetical protein